MKNTPCTARVPLALALAFGLGIALGGCAAEPAGGGDTEGSSQTEQGTTTGTDNEAPIEDAGSKGFIDEDNEVPGWLADAFPIFPESRVAGASEVSGVTIISFFTPSPDDQAVYSWFVDQYSQNGWTVDKTDEKNLRIVAGHESGHTADINVTQATGNATWVISAEQG